MSPFAALVAVLLFSPLAAAAVDLTGKVVAIADGDTLTLLVDEMQHRIRIDGIDAPERTQPYSQRARQSLDDLAKGKEATAHCSKIDRYGRNVCQVVVDGVDIGLEQIRRGFAWFFTRYADELPPERRSSYEAAEAEAKAAKRGLWREPAPMAPWAFREAKRNAAAATPAEPSP
jgi:endonuclease YncB( thermonuclease family)